MSRRGIEVIVCDTPELQAAHYALRYQVYCLERQFEACDQPTGLEQDQFDADAVHFLARDAVTGAPLGAVRLVWPQQNGFPAEKITALDNERLQLMAGQLVEVSRLCIVGSAQRGSDETFQGSDIMLALFRAAWRYSRSQGVSHWLCLITPALERLLGRLNVRFETVGLPCVYRGRRRPLMAQMDEVVRAAARACGRVQQLVGQDISAAMA